ncbi:MAG: OmpA family protein [Culturomica sp.]|jgi:outer membrane protein OmpA-like peptidoglycan-associated protein|nr:OmpA family protein [Culturomica sp.]
MGKKLLALLFATTPFFVSGQEKSDSVTVVQNESKPIVLAQLLPDSAAAFTEKYPAWVGYETNRFWDNWFISAGGGVQMYFGTADRKEELTKRLTPTADFSVGKWIVPTLGLRLQASGGELKGVAGDQSALYLTGEKNKDGFWKQSWEQVNAHLDIMVNLSNWIGGYRPNRFYEAVPYIGFGAMHACRSNGLTVLTTNAGIVHKFRLCESVDINLEMKGMIFDKKFAGEAGSMNALGGVTAGISYKFKQRTFRNTGTLLTDKELELAAAQQELAKAKASLVVVEERNKKLHEELEAAALITAEAAEAVEAVEKAMENPTVRVNPVVVFFNINTTQVSDRDRVNLRYIAKAIQQNPGKIFTISGYADNQTGSAGYNLRLSQKRAQNVYNLLTREFGVDPDQLKVEGKGGVKNLFESSALSRAAIIE